MTADETLILMMALICDKHPLTTRDIVLGLDVRADRAYYVASRLRQQGVLTKPRFGEWAITEKGRIACALAMHKDPSLYDAFFG